jgi:NAD(P)-dependent dehydrogenase (short-subunit alcohol dehydrogenase family)
MPARRVRGTTVVVTGASSGIGRATAVEFAKAGARLVVAGRRQERLDDLVREIASTGGEAVAVATDVSDRGQVEDLIQEAQSQFGSVDTLVNNAGIGIAASFQDQTLDDFRRVMDTNFWGAVYACRAVLPVMRGQASGGLIVNVSSILGKRGVPYETAYCASKFALAGFSEALRAEVMSEMIDVTTVFPGLVETDIFDSATNEIGLEMPAMVPKMPAQELARLLVQNALLPQPEIVMALDAQALNFFNTLAPGLLDLLMGQGLPFVEGFRSGAASSGDPKSS